MAERRHISFGWYLSELFSVLNLFLVIWCKHDELTLMNCLPQKPKEDKSPLRVLRWILWTLGYSFSLIFPAPGKPLLLFPAQLHLMWRDREMISFIFSLCLDCTYYSSMLVCLAFAVTDPKTIYYLDLTCSLYIKSILYTCLYYILCLYMSIYHIYKSILYRLDLRSLPLHFWSPSRRQQSFLLNFTDTDQSRSISFGPSPPRGLYPAGIRWTGVGLLSQQGRWQHLDNTFSYGSFWCEYQKDLTHSRGNSSVGRGSCVMHVLIL